ncbi:MAG: HEAT repeat domain-containing protein [Anaerolineae bacterium]
MTSIARVLSDLFKIEDSEWPLVITLFALIGVTTVGAIWGSTIAYAGLLKVVGIGALPWILGGAALLSVVGAAIYSAFAVVLSNSRLMVVIYVVGIVSLLFGLVLLQQGSPLAYPILYLLYVAWLPIYNPHLVTFITGFTDAQAAKRVVPVVLAGMRVGLIVAGLSMVVLNRLISPEGIVIIWLLSYVASIGLVWAALHVAPGGGEVKKPSRHDAHVSYVTSLREGAEYAHHSPYLRGVMAGVFVLLMLLALIEYRSSQLLSSALPTQAELSSYLGLLGAVGNIVALPVLLFGLSRVITRFGLGATSLVYPVINLFTAGWLFAVPGAASASAAYLDRSAFRAAFQFPVEGLLFNAVPLQMRARARSLSVGLVGPMGAFGGSLLLLLPLAAQSEWFVGSLVVVLSVLYLVIALIVRREYSHAVVRMLREEDYNSVLYQEASPVMVADPQTLTMLSEQLEASTSRDLTVFLAQLMARVGGDNAVPMLVSLAREAPDEEKRSAILDALSISGVSDPAVEEMYLDCLSSSDASVRLSGIVGLERLSPETIGRRMSRLLGMVNDPDLDVRVAVLSALAHADFLKTSPTAQSALEALLAHPDPTFRAAGVVVLCEEKDLDAVGASLVHFLSDPSDVVQLQAIHGIDRVMPENLSEPFASQLLDALAVATHDQDEPLRQQAVLLLGRVTQWANKAIPIIADTLADPSPAVRATAVDTLSQMGPQVADALSQRLHSDTLFMREGAAIVLCRLDRRAYKQLIQEAMLQELRHAYELYAMLHAVAQLPPFPGVSVLNDALRESATATQDNVFQLLTALETRHNVTLIRQHLCGTTNARADAVEALEALTMPQIGTLVAALCDPHRQDAHLAALSEETWGLKPLSAAQALNSLASPPTECILRAVALYALGEIGPSQDAPATGQRGAGQGQEAPRATFHLQLGGHAPDETPADEEGFNAAGDKIERATFRVFLGHRQASPGKPADRNAGGTGSETEAILSRAHIESLLDAAQDDTEVDVREAARAAQRALALKVSPETISHGGVMLSTIERVIFLKQVPFFEGLTVEQLRVLANVCDERTYAQDSQIYNAGDPGGVLYVVVDGKVGIEHEKRGGSVARLATVGSNSYFGEMDLFDDHPRSTSAVAVEATHVLELRREPLVALSRQYPDMSLELIKVLSARLREANDRIVELTRSRPRELNRLYDKLD